MKAVCVDDEENSLRQTLSLCGEMPQLSEVVGFRDPCEALAWIEAHPTDLALLDIRMPEMDGITLAHGIRTISPDTAILFVTAHPQYAVDAWRIHASGYLLKPLTPERLSEELDYAAEWRRERAD